MVVLVTHVQMKSYAFKIDQINQTFLGIFFFLFAVDFLILFIYLFLIYLFLSI